MQNLLYLVLLYLSDGEVLISDSRSVVDDDGTGPRDDITESA